VRTASTDANGLYRIIDLRPGVYTVTFTLPGFGGVRREGIELPANFTATINSELKVGAIEETVTVDRRLTGRRREERDAAAGSCRAICSTRCRPAGTSGPSDRR
jgi:hypothetical protein